MKQCQKCQAINSEKEPYCLTCGSAELEFVGDELPFEERGIKSKFINRESQEQFYKRTEHSNLLRICLIDLLLNRNN